MASEIEALAKKHEGPLPALLIMGGHQDGVLVYGSDAETTGDLVIRTLNKALEAGR
jgi:hypothetical protein